jgi:hypothetical protein
MLAAIFGDPTLVLMSLLVVVAAIADLVTGIVAAVLTPGPAGSWLGSLDVKVLARWTTEHLLRQVLPIVGGGLFASIVAYLIGRFPDADPMLATGLNALVAATWLAVIGAAVLYVTQTLNSIQGNLSGAFNRDKPVPPAA